VGVATAFLASDYAKTILRCDVNRRRLAHPGLITARNWRSKELGSQIPSRLTRFF